MKQTQGGDAHAHALIEKPPYAVVAKGEGHGAAAAAGPSHEARIRDAAYAMYEARGHVHGHDVDDWLAAEAQLAGASQGDSAQQARATH